MTHDAFTLLGDALWLDFVNSGRGRTPHPPDRLPDPAAFTRWCAIHRLDPAAPADFPRVLELRARLSALADALQERRLMPAGAVASLNALLARNPGCQRLTRVAGEWRLGFAPARASTALVAIARSAAATLADRLIAVRRCAAERCSLCFTDASPSVSRRWCDVTVCGANARIERRRGLLR